MIDYINISKSFYWLKFCIAILALVGCLYHPNVVFAEVGYSASSNTQPSYRQGSNFVKRDHYLGDSSGDDLRFRLGKWTLHPNFEFRGGHSDNVYFDESYAADTYVTFAPGIMLVYGERGSDYIAMNYLYESTKYGKETDLNYNGHLFRLDLHFVPGRYQLNLSDRYSNKMERELETSEQVMRVQNVENLTISREISSKTSWMFDQRYELYGYEDDRFLGYSELWFGGYLFHQTFRKIRTFTGGGFGKIIMDDSDVVGNADYIEFNIGLQGLLFSKTQIYAMGGWQNRTFEDDIEAIQEWSLLVGLSSRLSHRTSWSLDVFRRLTPSSQHAGFTRVSTSINPEVRYILWKDHFSASIDGSYEVAGYYGHQGELDFDDKFWRVNGELDWHVLELCTLSIGCAYSWHDSGIDEEDVYDQTHLFVRAVIK